MPGTKPVSGNVRSPPHLRSRLFGAARYDAEIPPPSHQISSSRLSLISCSPVIDEIEISRMSEKASLPLPGGQVSPPPRSQLPNIFLGGLLIFATFFSFQSSFPGANHVRCLGSKLGLGLDASNDHDVGIVYDDAWYEDHVECPAQPRPIFPKMTWNITNEEKKASVEKYIQAVVCPPRMCG